MYEIYQTLLGRRHTDIANKETIWKQIEHSYIGGKIYTLQDYLHRNPKESDDSYSARKKRAIYFNQVSPLVDMLIGFIYSKTPKRKSIEEYQYLIDKASRKKNFDQFMWSLAKFSLFYTTGVLVDSPKFNPIEIQTQQDRQEKNINPYCVIYKPFYIRDFDFDKDTGNLLWILLDNSYIEKSDPMKQAEQIYSYRLWEIGKFTDIIFNKDGVINNVLEANYNLDFIPFKFVNWRDDDNDFVSESICEDIALIAQSIFNNTSCMEEMIGSGSFRMLFYPTETGELPEELNAGVGPLSIIPYNGALQGRPFFDGASLQDITPFIAAMEFYMMELMKKIGMDTDEAKDFVKSGKAKQFDFEKIKTLLGSGAVALQQTEKWIFETAAAWEGKKNTNIDINYNREFLQADINDKMNRYMQLTMLPYELLRKQVHSLMVNTTIGNEIDQDILNQIQDEIKKYKPEEVNIDESVEEEKNYKEEQKQNVKQAKI